MQVVNRIQFAGQLSSMVAVCGALLVACFSWSARGDEKKQTSGEAIDRERKVFCAETKEMAAKDCRDWLDEQKKSLGARLLTSHCSRAEIGSSDCTYRSIGQLKYTVSSGSEENSPEN